MCNPAGNTPVATTKKPVTKQRIIDAPAPTTRKATTVAVTTTPVRSPTTTQGITTLRSTTTIKQTEKSFTSTSSFSLSMTPLVTATSSDSSTARTAAVASVSLGVIVVALFVILIGLNIRKKRKTSRQRDSSESTAGGGGMNAANGNPNGTTDPTANAAESNFYANGPALVADGVTSRAKSTSVVYATVNKHKDVNVAVNGSNDDPDATKTAVESPYINGPVNAANGNPIGPIDPTANAAESNFYANGPALVADGVTSRAKSTSVVYATVNKHKDVNVAVNGSNDDPDATKTAVESPYINGPVNAANGNPIGPIDPTANAAESNFYANGPAPVAENNDYVVQTETTTGGRSSDGRVSEDNGGITYIELDFTASGESTVVLHPDADEAVLYSDVKGTR